MEQTLRNKIKDILVQANQENWADDTFSSKKALICAKLSSLVYLDVQEYELKKASRIHLFASEEYTEIIKSRKPNDFLNQIAQSEWSEAKFFVVRGRYAIIFATVMKNVVILSVRGTVFTRLWDWKANIDATKYYVQSMVHDYFDCGFIKYEDNFFHRGFFKSVISQFRSINDELKKLSLENCTIIWTGHSLGGAMAAIGQCMWEAMKYRPRFYPREELSGRIALGYTFGMPRYCGLGTILTFSSPHHIYKKQDIVPTLPCRKMGFVDCPREYELTEHGINLAERTDSWGVLEHLRSLPLSIKAHSIEGYVSDLESV